MKSSNGENYARGGVCVCGVCGVCGCGVCVCGVCVCGVCVCGVCVCGVCVCGVCVCGVCVCGDLNLQETLYIFFCDKMWFYFNNSLPCRTSYLPHLLYM